MKKIITEKNFLKINHMKKTFLLIVYSLSFITFSLGQNLVPNGDFEIFSGCPTNYSQIDSAPPWRVPTLIGSSDYYNQCASSSIVGVPSNIGGVGYQPAHSGGAYSGMYIWYAVTESREYIEVQLISPLIANQCYHFEMYVNVYNGSNYTTSTIGAYFSDTLLSGINSYTALPYPSQINNTSGNMFDTTNWTLVSGNYTAAGGESFLTIGNFKDNANSDTLQITFGTLAACYVHIDDVSLTPCTGIEEQNENDLIKIYPNPVGEELLVAGLKFLFEKNTTLKIYDVLGKQVQPETKNLKAGTKINVSALKKGIHCLEINNGKNIFRKKFLKN
jgi:hypothetical protein